MTRTVKLVLGSLLAIHSIPVNANQNSFGMTPALLAFHYQELSESGEILDTEKGLLPGIRSHYEHGMNGDRIQLHASLFGNTVDYVGQTQSGAPHQTDTEERIFSFGFRVLPRPVAETVGLVFGFQHHNWDRNILTRNNVAGLHEVYTWNEIEAGVKFTSIPADNSQLWLDITGLYTLNPEMEIRLDSGRYQLQLDNKPGARMRAGKTWAKSDRVSISANVLAEYWSFGRSNTILVSDFFGSPALVTEPTSETANVGVEFIFSKKF